MAVLGFVLAALIGLSLGLLGGGGSILTVPVLVYVLGFAAKPAIAMSLPVVGITSLIGAGLHWRRGNVRIGTALTFGAFAMVGAYGGARLAAFVSGAAQLAILSLVMLVAAVSMLRGRREEPVAAGAEPPRFVLIAPVALAVGALTGLVGIGGGFLIVPALAVLGRIPMRESVGTSLLVIALNAGAGFAGYVGTVAIDWGFLAAFASIAVLGALAGTALVGVIPAAALRRAFGVFLILVGGFVLYMNRGVLTGTPATSAGADLPSVATPR